MAEFGEEGRAHAGDVEGVLDDPPALTEVDPVPAGSERVLWAVVLPADEGEVVVQHAGFEASALLDCELERLAHVLDSLPLSQAAAGYAAVAECPRRCREPKPGGEIERLVGDR